MELVVVTSRTFRTTPKYSAVFRTIKERIEASVPGTARTMRGVEGW